MKSEVLKNELDLIKDEKVKEFTEKALESLPDYFWTVPASSSGKYHPVYALGDGGLVRHTIAATNIAQMLLGLEQYKNIFDDKAHDCIIASIMLHDGFKQGKDSASHHTVKDHATICSEWIMNEFGSDLKITKKDREFISELIRTHMGEWDENNKPTSPGQKFVHMCDYLASRKTILFDFEGRVTSSGTSSVNPETVALLLETCQMPFGKYKGQLIKDIAKENAQYLGWALENMTYLKEDIRAVIRESLGQEPLVTSPIETSNDSTDDLPF